MPIVYVRDMDESVAFHTRLGFHVDAKSRSQMWTELRAGEGAVLALHAAPEGGSLAASTCRWSRRNLSKRVAQLATVACGIVDEAFGRSLVGKTRTASGSR